MEKNKYKIIKTNTHKEWVSNCPVKVDKSQLLLDTQYNKLILQIKLFNLSDGLIKSVYLDINTYDDAMDPVLKLTDVTYLAIEAKPHSYFGDRQPILLESLKIANIEIIINKVVFNDDTIWRNENKEIGSILQDQKQLTPNEEFYDQIIREFSKTNSKPKFYYEFNNEYWRCTCGQTNSNDSQKCGFCEIQKECLDKIFDKQYLKNEEIKFKETEILLKKKEKEDKQKLEEKKRIELEEKKINDEVIKIKRKKKKKYFILSTSIIAFICLTFYISFKIYMSVPLAKLAESSNIDKIEKLIDLGKNVDEIDKEGRTALYVAVEQNNKKLVNFLLSKKADINGIGSNDNNLITTSYYLSNLKMLKMLLSKGADIYEYNKNEKNLIDISFNDNNYEVLTILIGYGLNDKTVLSSNETLLNTAIIKNDYSMVEFLMDKGFNINDKNSEGKTPLELAYEVHSQDIITLLQNEGAKAVLHYQTEMTVGNSLDDEMIYVGKRSQRSKINVDVETFIFGNDKRTIVTFNKYYYTGDFYKNQITGKGYLYYKDNDHLIYSGGWKKGLYSGKGTIYFQNYSQEFLVGEFVDGNPVKYTSYYSDGNICDKGTISKDGVCNSDKYGTSQYP